MAFRAASFLVPLIYLAYIRVLALRLQISLYLVLIVYILQVSSLLVGFYLMVFILGIVAALACLARPILILILSFLFVGVLIVRLVVLLVAML